jgi:hypothetical protein
MVVGPTNSGTAVADTSLPSVLQALQRAGGYSSLYIVAGGGGCTPSTSQIELSDETGYTMEDPTVADPDVVQALVALPELTSQLNFWIYEGYIDGIGIDLSGTTAALDVVWDSASVENPLLLPATFEGVPVENSVIDTVDLTGSWMSPSS